MSSSDVANSRLLSRGAFIVVVAVSLISFWSIFHDGPGLTRLIGNLGFFLTGCALALALLIFKSQAKSAQRSEDRIIEHMVGDRETDVMKSELVHVAPTAGTTLGGDEGGPGEPADAGEVARMGVSEEVASNMKVYSGTRVPLRVIADLVAGWRANGQFDAQKGWDIGQVWRAYRGRGKGSHSWYLVIGAAESEDPTIWKVSVGGQSKTTPTVEELY